MKIYQMLQIGEYHTNHCEDSLLVLPFTNQKYIIAVMDGCSSGTDSHFASALIGKILKKLTIELGYLEFASGEDFDLKVCQKKLLRRLFTEFKKVKNQLLLDTDELLSTLILAIISKETKSAEIITIGDGLIAAGDMFIEYEQDNAPDYLGYHLNKSFEEWFEQQYQVLSFSNLKDLSISTDGILTFQKINTQTYPPLSEKEILHFLLKNKEGINSPNMFRKKLIQIEEDFGLKPTDDLGIIRVIF